MEQVTTYTKAPVTLVETARLSPLRAPERLWRVRLLAQGLQDPPSDVGVAYGLVLEVEDPPAAGDLVGVPVGDPHLAEIVGDRLMRGNVGGVMVSLVIEVDLVELRREGPETTEAHRLLSAGSDPQTHAAA